MNGRIDWARSRRRIFVQDRSIVFIFVLRFSLFDLYDSLRLPRWEGEGGIEKFASYQKNPVDCRVNSDSFSIFPRDARSAGGYRRWIQRGAKKAIRKIQLSEIRSAEEGCSRHSKQRPTGSLWRKIIAPSSGTTL